MGTQKWNILVRQFDSTQTEYLAPRGCLQYYREDLGTLETFNYNGGNGELLNDHMYTMCIAQNDAYCDVALSSSSFMLGGSSGACSDAVVFGTNQLCGSTFGTSGQLNWNYTGSYNVPFMSDSDSPATASTPVQPSPLTYILQHPHWMGSPLCPSGGRVLPNWYKALILFLLYQSGHR